MSGEIGTKSILLNMGTSWRNLAARHRVTESRAGEMVNTYIFDAAADLSLQTI